jgi:ubiquinone/menaquinone biosynthesis C-methylase UbiE
MKTKCLKISLAFAVAIVSIPFLLAQSPKAVYFERQEVVIPDFAADGFILDIGGGGEGVIGQLKGSQVISIDPYKEELENAPSGNLKIVMDGRDLKFLDNSFNTAAIFYTLMYISAEDHEKVFQEVKRVLKHGGRLLIWDVNLPVWKDVSKEFGVYKFKFRLPQKEINTGYGARFPKKVDQNMQYYVSIAQKIGLKVLEARNNEASFYLELQTPPAVTDAMEKEHRSKNIAAAVSLYEKLKENNKNDYYFGGDVLTKWSDQLIAGGKISDSVIIFKLALKDYSVNENKTNAYGYRLLAVQRYSDAIEIFKINAARFPNSANAFDSLAEAYMRNGQKDLAVEYYEKSMKLNPNNTNAVDMIQKLKR